MNTPTAFLAYRTKLGRTECVGLYYAHMKHDRRAMAFHAKHPAAYGSVWRFEPFY